MVHIRPATGMGWGELVHKLLEVALRRGRCEREYLERVARWFTFGKPDLMAACLR